MAPLPGQACIEQGKGREQGRQKRFPRHFAGEKGMLAEP